jgi:hypothetical protein
MSDVMSANEAMIAPMLAKVDELRNQITEIDKTLNVEGATKTRILDDAADKVAAQYGDIAQQLVDTVNGEHGDSRVGVIALVRRVLREFDSEVKSYVDANTPESSGPTVPTEELQAKRDERKKLVDGYDAIRSVLVNFGGEDIANRVPKIQNLRGRIGGEGPRGIRLAGTWEWNVDGVDLAGKKLSDVQKATGASSATDVREALKAANPKFFESKEAQDTFNRVQFTVNGKTVVGVRSGSDVEDDDSDDVVDSPNNEDVFGGMDDDDR